MKTIIMAFAVLTLAFSVTNCASKKKSGDTSVLEPDGGDPLSQGGVLDASGMNDQALNPSAAGSDAGAIPGLYTVNFPYDGSNLTDDAKQKLASNAEWMNANPNVKVQVEGHCDERGSIEYNLALGERRAKAVKNYLVSLGVSSKQLVTISYGEERLLSYGDTEGDHSKNRRANFLPLQ
ncbi:MAG: OmpA family protein [Bdellovibrionaceae bacterium]|nr:OmpA family protein [Pseudobdellovibrionaceae bacterium]